MKRWNNLFAVLLLTLFARTATVTAQNYDMIMLEPPGYAIKRVLAIDLDELGNAAGWFEEADGTYHGFYYDRQTASYSVTENDLAVLGINNLGEMVGEYWGDGFAPYGDKPVTNLGYYWSAPDADPIPLPPLVGHELTGCAGGINDRGLIAGWSADEAFAEAPPYEVTPVVWTITDTGVSAPVALPLLPDHLFGSALAISPPNANGVSLIVGRSGLVANGQLQIAVSWKVKLKSNGTLVLQEGPVNLGSLGAGEDQANGVNDRHLAVGVSGGKAFKKTKRGTMQSLKPLKVQGVKAPWGAAWDINDRNDIVGTQSFPQGSVSNRNAGIWAVLWIKGKTVVNLTKKVELGRRDRLDGAFAINNAGEIVVAIDFENVFGSRAALLVPID